jgi:hypothetical protein
MPKIDKVFSLEITPERFLGACSFTELQEVDLLIGSYLERKKPTKRPVMEALPERSFCVCISDMAKSRCRNYSEDGCMLKNEKKR